MSLERIQTLLAARIGLDARSIGVAAVRRAIEMRVGACQVPDAEQYWQRVQGSPEELQALIELVVVPETWFFRDREAFCALTGLALREQHRTHSGTAMRLLSLPCATGEEPYSMGMALLDAGVAPERFRIDALDVSRRAIEIAEQARYGRNAFRGSQLDFRSRYFEPREQGYQLDGRVRKLVSFRVASLFDGSIAAALPTYDAVFCRNLLIYFDRASQAAALQILGRLLSPTGLLFVGPSEGALLLDHGFVYAQIPRAFCFRRPETPSGTPGPSALAPGTPLATAAGSTQKSTRPRTGRTDGRTGTGTGSSGTSAIRASGRGSDSAGAAHSVARVQSDGLDVARRLADDGSLAEALTLCEQHLRQAPSADAYCLSALIHEAAGRRDEAQTHYRKALYLDPTHAEALTHLATVLMRDGNSHEAQRLLMRAQRGRAVEG